MFKLKDFAKGKQCLDVRSYIQAYFENNCPETRYDNDFIQCYSGCNRSFYDIYFIAKSKFPKTTRSQLAYILLYNLGYRSDKEIIRCIRCPKLQNLVFYGIEFH